MKPSSLNARLKALVASNLIKCNGFDSAMANNTLLEAAIYIGKLERTVTRLENHISKSYFPPPPPIQKIEPLKDLSEVEINKHVKAILHNINAMSSNTTAPTNELINTLRLIHQVSTPTHITWLEIYSDFKNLFQ
jgi:hypothetical protein